MKRLLAAVLAAVLLFSPITICDAHDFAKIMQAVAPMQAVIPTNPYDPTSTATLQNICTTTSINAEQHLWLTAAHCVEIDEMTGGVRYINGDLAVIVMVSPKDDIAIVRTERAYAPSLKLARQAPDFGDKLKVVGHPLGMNVPILTFGQVAHPSINIEGKDYMIYSVVAAPGNSGSSVLNGDDEVVSVLQVGWDRSFGSMTGGATFEQLRRTTIGYWQQ